MHLLFRFWIHHRLRNSGGFQMTLALAIILIVSLAAVVMIARLLQKRDALWWKCAWHKTEFWYSDRGHTQPYQPWHIRDEDVSHGCCKNCSKEFLKT